MSSLPSVRDRIRAAAPWLLEPELGVCVVGSTALAEACRRAGIEGPAAHDLDLSWLPSPDVGESILRQHDVYVPTTDHNRGRGTLAMYLPDPDGGRERIEITTLRAGEGAATTTDRITADVGARDMTVGSVAWWLEPDRILDPQNGVEDWRAGRIRATGHPDTRIREHPVRWLRYYRRAHQWGFELDPRIRKLGHDRRLLDELARIPPEAVAAELRAALLDCASPGALLMELYEAGVLGEVAPEIAPQFDGRAAGPIRYHPEISQALHVVLALEWIVDRTRDLDPADQFAARFAVLCHDLGKNLSPLDRLPSHRGHEQAGTAVIDDLVARLPGLADQSIRRLAIAVAELHLTVRNFDELRPGTLATLFGRWFRAKDLRIDLFSLALGADVGGRLGMSAEGDETAACVLRDIHWLQERCRMVDVKSIRERHPDLDDFRRALHEAHANALSHRRKPPAP